VEDCNTKQHKLVRMKVHSSFHMLVVEVGVLLVVAVVDCSKMESMLEHRKPHNSYHMEEVEVAIQLEVAEVDCNTNESRPEHTMLNTPLHMEVVVALLEVEVDCSMMAYMLGDRMLRKMSHTLVDVVQEELMVGMVSSWHSSLVYS